MSRILSGFGFRFFKVEALAVASLVFQSRNQPPDFAGGLGGGGGRCAVVGGFTLPLTPEPGGREGRPGGGLGSFCGIFDLLYVLKKLHHLDLLGVYKYRFISVQWCLCVVLVDPSGVR